MNREKLIEFLMEKQKFLADRRAHCVPCGYEIDYWDTLDEGRERMIEEILDYLENEKE